MNKPHVWMLGDWEQAEFAPAVKDAARKLPGLNNGRSDRKKRGRSKKSASAS